MPPNTIVFTLVKQVSNHSIEDISRALNLYAKSMSIRINILRISHARYNKLLKTNDGYIKTIY